jgi:hypothetical protein
MEGCHLGSEHPECEVPASEAIPEEDDLKNDEVLRNFIETYEALPEL